jgi:hypothetical protein
VNRAQSAEPQQVPPDQVETAYLVAETLQANRILKMAADGEAIVKMLNTYYYDRCLGSGGMGSVHLIRDKVNGERLALKIMRGWLAEDDRAARRFLREIEIAKGLNHINIVRFYDIFKTEEAAFYTMEYCDQGTLADYVRLKGPLSVEETLDISSL